MFDLINIELIDLIDISVVGILIYQAYKLIRGTAALNIFTGILLFYFLWLIVRALKMELLGAILGQVIGVGVLALIILFQQEIRRFFLRMGTTYLNSGKRIRIFSSLFQKQDKGLSLESLGELTHACRKMSETKTGALIVLSQKSSLDFIIESGDRIDGILNRRLIENIFFKNAPLHDGAMIVSEDKIVAARCTLPITENLDLPPHLGMRHKAAIGVSEISDAAVIVVSEESGQISFIINGKLKKINSISELRLAIENLYK